MFWGNSYGFTIPDPLDRLSEQAGADATLAPMPGRVVSVDVSVGDQVVEGQRLTVLEAMKMEHSLVASRPGEIEEVTVSEGDQVAAGDVLIRLKEVIQ